MGRLTGMIMRVAIWGAFGAALGFAGVAIYQIAFTGGAVAHSFSSGTAHMAAVIGLIAGGIVGFFRRN